MGLGPTEILVADSQAFSSREKEDNWRGQETTQGKRRLNIQRFKNCGLVLISDLLSTFGKLF